MRYCEVPDCNRPYLAKGKCRLHYYRDYNKCSIERAPVYFDDIVMATKIHDDYVECPLYNKKHEIVDYCKLDRDIWEEKFKGSLMNKSNYGYARAKGTFVHYEIIGKPKDRWTFIDHVNRDRLDNRRTNLRFVTPAENCRNSKNYGGGTGKSGVQGVVFCKDNKTRMCPWRVTLPKGFLTEDGKKMKYFRDLKDAIAFRSQFPFWGNHPNVGGYSSA